MRPSTSGKPSSGLHTDGGHGLSVEPTSRSLGFGLELRFRLDRLFKALERAESRVVALLPEKLIQPRRTQVVPAGESLLSEVSRFQGVPNGGTNVM